MYCKTTIYFFFEKNFARFCNPKGGATVKGNGFGYSRSRKGTGDLVKRRGPRTRGRFLISGLFFCAQRPALFFWCSPKDTNM